jgi:iron-sulfur cluster assembly accessory protein
MQINITPSASKQISLLCAQTGKIVRLSINSGGCQGFSKVWDLTDHIEDDDEVWELDDGKLLIDPISLDIMQGAVIDYKNELNGSYFSVDIPSASSTCGCGVSFSI